MCIQLLEEQGEMEDALTCLLQYCHRHTLRLNPTRSLMYMVVVQLDRANLVFAMVGFVCDVQAAL